MYLTPLSGMQVLAHTLSHVRCFCVTENSQPVLSYAIQQSLVHYHAERNHQGLGNQLITPEPERSSHGGAVVRRERLGRLLHSSYLEAA
jgi:hypothetical protein